MTSFHASVANPFSCGASWSRQETDRVQSTLLLIEVNPDTEKTALGVEKFAREMETPQ
ncbi:MAG: hypothetical protein LBQ54_13000 [Planctomycetaceae bacterium]|nr:hypothetical protein [Planctomycetaceae bacterium]